MSVTTVQSNILLELYRFFMSLAMRVIYKVDRIFSSLSPPLAGKSPTARARNILIEYFMLADICF